MHSRHLLLQLEAPRRSEGIRDLRIALGRLLVDQSRPPFFLTVRADDCNVSPLVRCGPTDRTELPPGCEYVSRRSTGRDLAIHCMGKSRVTFGWRSLRVNTAAHCSWPAWMFAFPQSEASCPVPCWGIDGAIGFLPCEEFHPRLNAVILWKRVDKGSILLSHG